MDCRHCCRAKPFTNLGLDSLAVIDLRTRLRELTGVELPARVLFDHPTVTELAGHLREWSR